MAITPTIKTIPGPTRQAAAQAAPRPAPAGFDALLGGLIDPASESAPAGDARQNPDAPERSLGRLGGERAWPMSMVPALDPYGGMIQTREPVRFAEDDQNPDVLQSGMDDDGESVFDEPFEAERSGQTGPSGQSGAAEPADLSGDFRYAVNREMRMIAARTVIAMPLDNYALSQKAAPEASRVVAAAGLAEPVGQARGAQGSRRSDRTKTGSIAEAAPADAIAASKRSARVRAEYAAVAEAGRAVPAVARGSRPKIYLSSLPARPQDAELGMLSSRFESHVHGAAAIGHDERGGTSYGRFQLSSRHGMVDAFIQFLRDKAPDWGKRLNSAGAADTGGQQGAMPAVWRSLAKEDPGRFEKLQHEFVMRAFYQPAAERIRASTGRDVGELSPGVREALWSAAVQHGPNGAASIFSRAVKRVDKLGLQGVEYERALINEAYKVRRGRFGALSPQVQAAVGSRLKKEQSMALSMLVMKPASERSGEA